MPMHERAKIDLLKIEYVKDIFGSLADGIIPGHVKEGGSA